jgi:hypothetical protein
VLCCPPCGVLNAHFIFLHYLFARCGYCNSFCRGSQYLICLHLILQKHLLVSKFGWVICHERGRWRGTCVLCFAMLGVYSTFDRFWSLRMRKHATLCAGVLPSLHLPLKTTHTSKYLVGHHTNLLFRLRLLCCDHVYDEFRPNFMCWNVVILIRFKLSYCNPAILGSFVSMYNGEKVKFGKVEKKIACEVAKSDSPWHPKPDRRAFPVPKLRVRDTDSAQESRLPSIPTKTMDRELHISTGISSAVNFRDKSFEGEEEEEVEDDGVSETELRAMEGEIWDQFEDEDDIALDLELSQEEGLDGEDEPSQIRSAMSEDDISEPVESVRGRNTDVEETGDSRVSSRKARESLHEEDVDEETL